MGRSDYIYTLQSNGSNVVFAAFTVKYEMATYLYEYCKREHLGNLTGVRLRDGWPDPERVKVLDLGPIWDQGKKMAEAAALRRGGAGMARDTGWPSA